MATTNAEPNVTLTREQIGQAALALSLEDREELTKQMLQSVERDRSDVENSWIQLAQQRLDAFERGETGAIDHDELTRLIERDLHEIDADKPA